MATGHNATLTPSRTQPGPPPPRLDIQAGVPHLEALAKWYEEYEKAQAVGPGPTPWVALCRLTIRTQIESRAGATVEAIGDRWAEHRKTGRTLVACNCGYTTGWVEAADLPSLEDLVKEHGGT